jgi:enediyne polyketide synthase
VASEPGTSPSCQPIAIVGLACRYPDADDPPALLDLVLTGRRAFRRLPPCRLDLADYYSADPAAPDATYSTRAALIEGWQFDQAAFGVSAAGYEAADPAHWLALETTARALAAAGFPSGKGLARNRVGVVIGNTLAGDISRAAALRLRWPYVRRVLADAMAAAGVPRQHEAPVLKNAAARYLAPFPEVRAGTLAGSRPASIASAICGYFGFRGGGYAIDGASSSSLLAVASACGALIAGELDVALAGGVDVSLDPFELVGLAKAGLLATGEMRVYDERPTGFLPGEGCGVVVLMRTADARAAGLPVYAEIAGWGMSSAGQSILTAPDPGSQLLALRRAYQRAGIDPVDVQLIEGHGTGTPAGDLAELTALTELRKGARQAAAVGSITANIGHAKAAAGAAGLIKTVLAMSSDVMPPMTGVTSPHALLRDKGATLRLLAEPAAWPDGPRIAGVSAMDPGGANVHLVLSSDPGRASRHDRKRRALPRGPRPAARLAPVPAAAQRPAAAAAGTIAYLVQAPGRASLAMQLARIADIAPWLSDAELHDLACQLAREAGARGQARIAIVAGGQEQLAVLAHEAIMLLPDLTAGPLVTRPGIFAADGAVGRVALLLSGGDPAAAAPGGQSAGDAAAQPAALAWLDQLGVQATAAVGRGLGEIAGLAWAGSLTAAEATRFAWRWGDILADPGSSAEEQDGRSAQLRTLLTQFVFNEPRRRLFSAATGRAVTSADDIVEALHAQLSSQDWLDEALGAAAAGADLLIETGPGESMSAAAARYCPVPVASLAAGTGTGTAASQAAAALFAAGALSLPQALYAGEPARPIDIWRARIFIASPCEVLAPGPVDTPVAAAGPAADSADQGDDHAVPGRPEADQREDPAEPEARHAAQDDSPGKPAAPPAAPAPVLAVPGAAVAAAGPVLCEPAASWTATDAGPWSATRRHDPLRRPAPLAAGPLPGAAFLAAPVDATPDEPALDEADATPADTGRIGTVPADTGRIGTVPADAAQAGAIAADPVPAGAVPADTTPDDTTPAGTAPADVYAIAEDEPVTGIGRWTRCYAEQLRPPRRPVSAGDDRPWRVTVATDYPFKKEIDELFPDEPGAGRTLAIVGGADDPDACAVALRAAQDAISTGRLVVISNGPGFTGFWASLHAEHPSLGITLLRVPQGADGLRAARRHAAATPGQFRELSIDRAGQPFEPVMEPALLPGGGTFPFGPADVVLVSRGTRGTGLALAQVLACCGAPVAIIGRSAPGEDSEVANGLERLRSAGARVAHEVIDVADPAELAAAVARIEGKLGPVTAIGHAAAAGQARLIAELTEAEFRAHAAAETAGLRNLVSSIKIGRLRLIATFGSVIGRYGMAAESLLAHSSGLLAEQALHLSDAIPGCRAMHVDWPGWSGAGLGERADLAAGLARTGITAIPVEQGSRLLLRMLATPELPARIAVHGRVGVPAPAAIGDARPQLPGPGSQPPGPDGQPPSSGGRFLEILRVHYPGVELVSEARLSLRADPYLDEHRVDGMPVLPAAMALEAMAQAATVLAGRAARQATSVSMIAPVVVPASQPGSQAVIRICALRDGDTVRTALRCAESGFVVDHFRATFCCSQDAPGAAGLPAGPGAEARAGAAAAGDGRAAAVDGTDLYGPICFESGRFRRVAFLPEVSPRGCRALARGADDQPWFAAAGGRAGAPLILGSPGLNDATMHVLQACVPDRRLQAAGCDAVTFSGSQADGVVEIRAVAKPAAVRAEAPAGAPAGIAGASCQRPVPQPRSAGWPTAQAATAPEEFAWDVDAVDSAGKLLVSWRGLRLRDAGPLSRATAWPPSLLSVYLERSAAALGLDHCVRVSVRCGQPGPAPVPASAGAAQVAPGSDLLAGFALRIEAPGAPACSWHVADPELAGPAADPRLAGLRTELARRFREPRETLNARLRAIAACLPAPDPRASHLVIDPVPREDWLLLHAGSAVIACTVAEIRGVPRPVAIALATGCPGSDPGRLPGPEQPPAARDQARDQAQDQPRDQPRDQTHDQARDQTQDQAQGQTHDQARDQAQGQARDQTLGAPAGGVSTT